MGKLERLLHFVADHKQAEHAGVGVEAIDAHGVVVIPEHGGILAVGIKIRARLSRDVPILGIAVAFRRRLGAVHVDDAANFGIAGFGAMKRVVDRQKMLGGQFVRPFDRQPFPAPGFKRGARHRSAAAPEPRSGKIAMQFALDLLHRDAIIRRLGFLAGHRAQPGGFGDRGNRQGIDKLGQGIGIQGRGGRCSARGAGGQATGVEKSAAGH